MFRSPHPFPIGKCSEIHRIERAWEIGTHTFHKVWILFSTRFPSYVMSYSIENAWLAFSHQFTIASIPDTLELKANHIKRRRGGGCNFIKKEEYKYTLGKSLPPYTKLSLLLTIGSKNYNFYPNISTKSEASVAFGRKVNFSIHNFLLPCHAVVVLLHKLLSFVRWHHHIEFVDIVILSCHYYQW